MPGVVTVMSRDGTEMIASARNVARVTILMESAVCPEGRAGVLCTRYVAVGAGAGSDRSFTFTVF